MMRGLAIACILLLAGCVSADTSLEPVDELPELCDISEIQIQSGNSMIKVGSWAVAIGILSLFIGSYIGISKYVSGLVILSGVSVAVFGPALSEFMSTDTAHWVMTGVLIFVAVDLIIIISYKSWALLKKVK